MLKKLTLFIAVFAMLVMLASPAYAMLKMLEPELSDELKAIAKDHAASSRNIDAASITVDEAWLREFFNVKVDVYMVEATIDKGLATEQKIQIPVRVDTKTALSEADFALLTEQDNALAPEEPVMRIMSATVEDKSVENHPADPNTPVTNEQPVAQTPPDAQNELVTDAPLEVQSQPVAEDAAASQTGGNTVLFVGGAILAAAALFGGLKAVHRKA
jgi:hypothetical protein